MVNGKMFEGKNVYLVPIKDKDTDNIIKWRNQPFVRNMFLQKEILTKEIHENWMSTMVKTKKVEQFIIYLKENDKAIGTVFLKNIDMENKQAEYGNFIGEPEYLGKGYGSDAGNVLIQYAFNQLNLKKIFLRVLKTNVRAIRAYKKMGFHDMNKLEGIREDLIFMEITSTNEKINGCSITKSTHKSIEKT